MAIWPVQPIPNAKDTNLAQNPGTLPNMMDVVSNWFQLLTFDVITKTLVDFEVQEVTTSRQFQGVVMTNPQRKLVMKPNGQRLWQVKSLYCWPTVQLSPDDVVVYQGQQYRVMQNSDYVEYGLIEYYLLQDYTGAGPTVEPSFTDKSSLRLVKGSNQSVNMGSGFLKAKANSFSINTWVYVNAATTVTNGTIAGNLSSAVVGYSLGWTDVGGGGGLSWFLCGGLAPFRALWIRSVGVAPSVQAWHMVTATYKGTDDGGTASASDLKLYIDGSAISTTTLTNNMSGADFNSTSDFVVGDNPNDAFPTDSTVDEMSFWNKALTAQEVSNLYNNGTPTDLTGATGAVSWWRFGDAPDDPAVTYDRIGSNNGTLIGGPSYTSNVP